MIAVEDTAPERPAARAKGTVSPSAIPMTMSRTRAEAEKCFSTCGVVGMQDLKSGAGASKRLKRRARRLRPRYRPAAIAAICSPRPRYAGDALPFHVTVNWNLPQLGR